MPPHAGPRLCCALGADHLHAAHAGGDPCVLRFMPDKGVGCFLPMSAKCLVPGADVNSADQRRSEEALPWVVAGFCAPGCDQSNSR